MTSATRFSIPRGTRRVSVEGVTRWLRQDPDTSRDCVCCDGPHVFSHTIDLPEDIGVDFDGTRLTAKDWLWHAYSAVPEGSRVRITVEVIDEETPQ